MSEEPRGRKLLWWNLGIDPNKEADTGRQMMRTIALWLTAVVAVVVIITVALAIF